MKTSLSLKKLTAVLTALIMLFSVMPATAWGADGVIKAETSMRTPDLFGGSTEDEKILETVVDMEELRSYLLEQFADCSKSINIYSFNIPYTREIADALETFIFYEMPEAFHVRGLGIYYMTTSSAQTLYKITVGYIHTADEYKSLYAECQKNANKLLEGIKGNDSLSDVEKALLLHDRLAVWCEYDYKGLTDAHDMCGALVDRTAVCQGYAMAYAYLMNQIGIDNDFCSSTALYHAWNIIYIDDKPYHVDVTWDDKSRDVTGKVYHENFLRSSDGIYATGHNADDYISTPVDTTYDDYFWQDSNAEFQLIDNELYYIDHKAAVLKRVNGAVGDELCSVSDRWMASQNSMWGGNFSRLGSDGKSLFYSLSKGIYKYDLNTAESKVIFKPDLSIGEYFNVFGFTYKDGYLVCDLNDSPNFTSTTKELYQVKQLYDEVPPTCSIASTNDVSASQTVTLTLSDNAAVEGYYWGKNSTYTDNAYAETDEGAVEETIAEPGTYYLTVKDTSGNISETKSIVFYNTTLNANGGSVMPDSVLTAKGNSFTFPVPKRDGYIYQGWAASATAASGSETLTPSKDAVYYALWEKIPVTLVSIAVSKQPAKTEYYIGEAIDTDGLELKLTYSDNSVKYVSDGYSISGFNSETIGEKEITVDYDGKTVAFYITVIEKEKPLDSSVVMRFDVTRAYADDKISPTTQYANGYATLKNIDSTAMIPLRYIAEVSGFTVAYDEATMKTKVTNKATKDYLMITPGSATVEKYDADNKFISKTDAPKEFSVESGVTMGPQRFVCEALGLTVYYKWISNDEQYITVTTQAITAAQSDALIDKARALGL